MTRNPDDPAFLRAQVKMLEGRLDAAVRLYANQLGIDEDQVDFALIEETTRQGNRQKAARILRAGNRAEPPPIESLGDFLDRHKEPPPPLVEDLVAAVGHTLLVAQAKAGKTTTGHNLIRAGVDGEAFLNAYETYPVDGRFGLLDFELDEWMLDEWLRDQQIKNHDDVVVMSLKGRKSSFQITDPADRAEWAERIRAAGIVYVVLDCLAPALTANGLTESNDDIGIFLDSWEELLSMAECPGSMVLHHSGRVGEHARGGSRLDGWPTDELRLTIEGQDEESDTDSLERRRTAPRYLSAHGRLAGDFHQVQLKLGDHRHLSVSGAGRKSVMADAMKADVLDYITRHPAQSFRAIDGAVTGKQQAKREAIASLIREDEICVHPGVRQANYHYPVSKCPDPTDPSVHGGKLKI